MAFHLTSAAFKAQGAIPSKYTCQGENISPPLSWEGAPEGTVTFALIVDDPDAPAKTWTHWLLYDIPAESVAIEEGGIPPGALQGLNDFGDAAYGGPCPPSGIHRYFFKLYALNSRLSLPTGSSKKQLEGSMASHIIGKAELIGTYQRH